MPIHNIGSIAHSVAWGDDGPIDAAGPGRPVVLLVRVAADRPSARPTFIPPVRRIALARSCVFFFRTIANRSSTNERSPPPPLAPTASSLFSSSGFGVVGSRCSVRRGTTLDDSTLTTPAPAPPALAASMILLGRGRKARAPCMYACVFLAFFFFI